MKRVQFGIYQMPAKNEQGTSEKRAYARLISKETKKLDEICSFINECCSVNSADIKGVLDALSKLCREGTVVRFLCGTGRTGVLFAFLEDR